MGLSFDPDAWYFLVRCSKCGDRLGFAKDESKGAARYAGPAKLIIPCPVCGHRDTYSAEDVTSEPATKPTPPS